MMLVTVKHEDITNGIPRSCNDCPIALALRRLFPEAAVHVAYHRIAIDDGRTVTPDIVRKFVKDFDRGRPVEPFEFPLPEPGHVE